jgi:hypothetical protein
MLIGDKHPPLDLAEQSRGLDQRLASSIQTDCCQTLQRLMALSWTSLTFRSSIRSETLGVPKTTEMIRFGFHLVPSKTALKTQVKA